MEWIWRIKLKNMCSSREFPKAQQFQYHKNEMKCMCRFRWNTPRGIFPFQFFLFLFSVWYSYNIRLSLAVMFFLRLQAHIKLTAKGQKKRDKRTHRLAHGETSERLREERITRRSTYGKTSTRIYDQLLCFGLCTSIIRVNLLL